jgi:hypothetical protein
MMKWFDKEIMNDMHENLTECVDENHETSKEQLEIGGNQIPRIKNKRSGQRLGKNLLKYKYQNSPTEILM